MKRKVVRKEAGAGAGAGSGVEEVTFSTKNSINAIKNPDFPFPQIRKLLLLLHLDQKFFLRKKIKSPALLFFMREFVSGEICLRGFGERGKQGVFNPVRKKRKGQKWKKLKKRNIF